MGSNTKDEDKIQVHVVSSVKGGCGKTAFSLFKALDLAYDARNSNKENKEVSVVWIDADFRGTASKVLFYGKNEKDFKSMYVDKNIEKILRENPDIFDATISRNNQLVFSKEYVKFTINDYLRERIQETDKMLVRGYAIQLGKESKSINGIIDFIFSSPQEEDKKIFGYGTGIPTVEIGRFTYRMEKLLYKLAETGKMKTRAAGSEQDRVHRYRHIVIDMPPGDDAYSEALRSVVLRLVKEREKEIALHSYFVSTNDRGHLYALYDKLKDVLRKESDSQGKIYAVLNELQKSEFDENGDSLKNAKQEIGEMDNMGRVQIFVNEFSAEYYHFCRAEADKAKEFSYTIKEIGKKNEDKKQ